MNIGIRIRMCNVFINVIFGVGVVIAIAVGFDIVGRFSILLALGGIDYLLVVLLLLMIFNMMSPGTLDISKR